MYLNINLLELLSETLSYELGIRKENIRCIETISEKGYRGHTVSLTETIEVNSIKPERMLTEIIEIRTYNLENSPIVKGLIDEKESEILELKEELAKMKTLLLEEKYGK